MKPQQRKLIGQIFKKIPVLKGLAPSQTQAVLNICETRFYEPGDIVCARGAMSEDMHILISGTMSVTGSDGTVIAVLNPVMAVGEMGLIRRQERSAQVEAITPSNTITIARLPFEQLLAKDPKLKTLFYGNVVDSLSTKIVNDNLRALDHVDSHTAAQLTIHKLQKQLDYALSVIDDCDGLSRTEVERQFDEKMINEVVILFVDDETSIHSSVDRLLRKQSCNLLFAETGGDALELIEQYKVDLVITDIRMAPMDGCALAEEIGERYPDLPVIALSAMVSAEETEGHNFSGFIDKPIGIADFRLLVETTLTQDL
ncbi:MAG: response regulator [Gemmatimonadetes bacterium]|nr:response regulator [Gemmatimonadota bacterium]